MQTDFLHNQKDFGVLLRIVAGQMKVQPCWSRKTTGSTLSSIRADVEFSRHHERE